MLAYNVLGQACQISVDTAAMYPEVETEPAGPPSFIENEMMDATNNMMQICLMMWFLMHVIGGVIRSMVHIEPYYMIPEDPDTPAWKVIMFERLGP